MAVDDDREDKELFRRGIGFLHRARPLCGLPPGAFAHVERRLEQPVAKPRRRPLLLAAATLGLLLVAGTAFAVVNGGVAHLPVLGPWLAPAPNPAQPDRASKARRARLPVPPPTPAPTGAPREPVAPADPVVPAPAVVPPVVVPASAAVVSAAPSIGAKPVSVAPRKVALASPTSPAVAVAAPPAVAAAPAEVEAILDESRSLSAAIERWHRGRDASAALAALDDHEQRFAHGPLQLESRLLRAEILLAQGREREGVALLDQVTLKGSPRARELFTVRGELRIKLGRCREGRADLDEVLAKGMADAFARRATEALRHCP